MNYDAKHRANIAKYAKQMDQAFKSVIDQCSDFAKQKYSSSFNFNNPQVQGRAEKIFFALQADLEEIISDGMEAEWMLSNQKNNALVNSYIKSLRALKKADHFFNDNLDALEAFVKREVDGMNLSKKVWNIVDQFKGEMEAHLGIGIANGDSAATISRRTRQYLQNPDALFRRVRDKKGNLVLSKRAKEYHPGQGVYRSAYKNSFRLTSNETNLSYREADYTRWQQLDFVVGVKISISDQHFSRMPQGDICDAMQGVYPKNFRWTGWHVSCFCRATAVMLSEEEYDEFENALLEGRKYNAKNSQTYVYEMPPQYVSWMSENKHRFENLKSQPYWIQNNYRYGSIDNGLKKDVAGK